MGGVVVHDDGVLRHSLLIIQSHHPCTSGIIRDAELQHLKAI